MYSRIAGRLLTSPIAFLIAGLIDFGLFAGVASARSLCAVTHRMRRSRS